MMKLLSFLTIFHNVAYNIILKTANWTCKMLSLNCFLKFYIHLAL